MERCLLVPREKHTLTHAPVSYLVLLVFYLTDSIVIIRARISCKEAARQGFFVSFS